MKKFTATFTLESCHCCPFYERASHLAFCHHPDFGDEDKEFSPLAPSEDFPEFCPVQNIHETRMIGKHEITECRTCPMRTCVGINGSEIAFCNATNQSIRKTRNLYDKSSFTPLSLPASWIDPNCNLPAKHEIGAKIEKG